ncbi:hypothetical protein FB451DRAFT_1570159 [Mycena latifolia]|nr:hypothetical protein FB451DRAFT_1570159 [Mycena latifolia]
MSPTKAACFIGIHKAPPNLSRTEFEAKVNALGDAIAALPIAQENLFKLDIIFQNTLMDDGMKSVGLPTPAPTVVMSAEYKSLDHLAEMMQDPSMKELLAKADDFGFRKAANAFAADVITKVHTPEVTPGTNVICVYHCPPHLSADEFAKKMEGVMDDIIALPIRDCFSSYTLWVQNATVEKHLQELGYPAPEDLVVVRAEAENLDRMIEIFNHPEVGRVLTDNIRDFGFHSDSDNPAESCCFSADVATKINNY